jgi:hypothetical protein
MAGAWVYRPVGQPDAAAVSALVARGSAAVMLSADLRSEDMAKGFIRGLNTQQWSMPRMLASGSNGAQAADGLFFVTDVDMRNLAGRLVAVLPTLPGADEAIQGYLHELLSWFPYHRLSAVIPASLDGLCRAHEKAGFRPEGVMREYFVRGEALEDARVLGLLRPEFLSGQATGRGDSGE